ncbi:hypothetical protein FHX64_001378 [Microbacter margulisiae]|uniref:Uncharacterized protein n=1 Tax=Microbacter margulisiae TaxID=1350067 RepID=A0A7W5DR47_9PORP|nr:hypothetical protein [Microbacter margulisiae]
MGILDRKIEGYNILNFRTSLLQIFIANCQSHSIALFSIVYYSVFQSKSQIAIKIKQNHYV